MIPGLAWLALTVSFKLILSPALLTTPTNAEESVGKYLVTFNSSEPLLPSIEAVIRAEAGRLIMAKGGGIDHIEDQWASFVRDLQVRDSLDQPLHPRFLGKDGWRIEDGYNGSVSLSYKVDLSFAKEKWPPGNEQAGIWLSNSLYVVTKPLFVTSNVNGSRVVTFRVPSGWKITVPWEPLPGRESTYTVKGLSELIDNSIVVGSHSEFTFQEGNFTLHLALLGEMATSSKLVSSTLRAAVHEAGKLFPQTPLSTFLVTFFYAEAEDGESFETSFAFTTKTKPELGNIMMWGNNLSHELMHIWIGGQIHGEDSGKTEWFEEGFSDYYADLALSRAGLLPKDVFLRKMEKVLARYTYFKISSNFPKVSLAAAGARKGQLRFGVYDGGWTVGLCLDLLIRKKTDNRKSLDDLMQILYVKFALSRTSVTNESVKTLLGEFAGEEAREFFERYVVGLDRIPVDEFVEMMGLDASLQDYAAELWLNEKKNPTSEQRALFEGILRGQ